MGSPMLGERFWSRVVQDGDCWVWTGALRGNGYGSVSVNRKTKFAHRVAYEEMVAPIPEGLTIDHLCRRITCVNPYHMEPVPRGLNRRRGAAAVTHCPGDHEYTPDNTYLHRGCRSCKTCARERMRERRARAA